MKYLALAWLLASCASTRVWQQHDQFAEGSLHITLAYDNGDQAAAREVESVLPDALAAVHRWGEFAAPVSIHLQPTHAALEEAAYHFGYPWLRAWSRYDTVDLQSPRTWSANGANPKQVAELLAHELTHCLMYQQVGTKQTWAYKDLPLWFREGMASVSAGQGYRRPTVPQLAAFLRVHPRMDLLRDSESLYRSEPEVVYGASHRAFQFLLDQVGQGAIESLLAKMRAGASFAAAFQSTMGRNELLFAIEFDRYVRGSVGT